MKYLRLLVLFPFALLYGCATGSQYTQGENISLVRGPSVTTNYSPYTPALICLAETASPDRKVSISVGQLPDMTGKFTVEDGGYRVTQGATLMATTALGRIQQVTQVERVDTSVFQFEMDLAQKKILGDGKTYSLPKGKTINYRPIQSGSVRGSDYFITGGITELNFNINSGGAELGVNGAGIAARRYALNVAADLRLVDTKSLEVIKSVTLQKQIIGYEVKANVFQFFGNQFVNFNGGVKNNEPLQLGIRAILDVGITKLVGSVIGGSAERCIDLVEEAFLKDEDYAMNNPIEVAIDAADYINRAKVMPVKAVARKPVGKVVVAPVPKQQVFEAISAKMPPRPVIKIKKSGVPAEYNKTFTQRNGPQSRFYDVGEMN